jgi:hypothetical protein
MSGKIFSGSASIYEDQARILFGYYRRIAEHIVEQEVALEKQIAVAREEEAQFTAELKRKNVIVKVCYGAAALIAIAAALIAILMVGLQVFPAMALGLGLGLAPLGYGLYVLTRRKSMAARIVEIQTTIEGFETAHRDIPRDFKVYRLGIAFIPVAGRVAFEGKTFLVDYTGTETQKEFKLSTIRNNDLFATAVNGLEDLLKTVPIVEDSTDVEQMPTDQYSRSIQQVPYYGYFGSLDRKLRTVTSCLNDLSISSVELPVVFPDTSYAKFLTEFSATTPGNSVVFPIFDIHQHDDALATFHSLNKMKKSFERQSQRFEQVLRNLMVNIASTVQTVTGMKVNSTNKLVEQSNRLLFTILKASYNHYSPKLEAEEIERIRNESFNYQDAADGYQPFQLKVSSRVLYDPVSEVWIAEDGSKTSFPFGMQQIHEEIVVPILQNLLQETHAERSQIYHSIQDQKNSYLNKWHQDTEDFYGRNRAESADLINLMRSTFTEFLSNYNTLQALEHTEKQMEAGGNLSDTAVQSVDTGVEDVSAYELQRRQYQAVQEDFADYVDRLKEDIDRRAEKFRFIKNYDASLRDEDAQSMSSAGSRTQSLDERRKPLLAVNPLYAESSELAPPPSMEDLAQEHFSLNLNAIARIAIGEIDALGRS